MLGAGEVVDAHVVGQRDVFLAHRVGGVERVPALPVFGGGDGLHDLRASAGRKTALEQAVLAAADRILQPGVGEGESRVRIAEEAKGRAVEAVRLREALVEEDARRSDVRVDALEDDAQVLGFVEAVVEHVAQEAAALRGAVRERHRDPVAPIRAERVGLARAVALGVAQETDPVARRGKGDAGDRRVARAVGELVERAGEKRRALRQQADRAVVEELPAARRDRARRVFVALAHREPRGGLVQAGRRKGKRRLELARVVEQELVPHRLLDARRPRHVQMEEIRRSGQPRDPAAPDDGEAAPHQEAVARRFRRVERVVRRHVVQQVDKPLVAAVVDVVEQRAVALVGIGRAQDVEVGRVFDLAARVARRAADVDDAAVGGMRGVELAEEAPLDAHIGTGSAEGLAARKRGLRRDFYFCNSRKNNLRKKHGQQNRKPSTGHFGLPDSSADPVPAAMLGAV